MLPMRRVLHGLTIAKAFSDKGGPTTWRKNRWKSPLLKNPMYPPINWAEPVRQSNVLLSSTIFQEPLLELVADDWGKDLSQRKTIKSTLVFMNKSCVY